MHTKQLLDGVQHEKVTYKAPCWSLTLKEMGFLDSVRESLNVRSKTFLHMLNGTGGDGKKDTEKKALPFPAKH